MAAHYTQRRHLKRKSAPIVGRRHLDHDVVIPPLLGEALRR